MAERGQQQRSLDSYWWCSNEMGLPKSSGSQRRKQALRHLSSPKLRGHQVGYEQKKEWGVSPGQEGVAGARIPIQGNYMLERPPQGSAGILTHVPYTRASLYCTRVIATSQSQPEKWWQQRKMAMVSKSHVFFLLFSHLPTSQHHSKGSEKGWRRSGPRGRT